MAALNVPFSFAYTKSKSNKLNSHKGFWLRIALQLITSNLKLAGGPLQLTVFISQIQQMRWPFLRPLAPYSTPAMSYLSKTFSQAIETVELCELATHGSRAPSIVQGSKIPCTPFVHICKLKCIILLSIYCNA